MRVTLEQNDSLRIGNGKTDFLPFNDKGLYSHFARLYKS